MHFKCAGCGNCCETPGYVHITLKEAAKAAHFLGISPAFFKKKHLSKNGRGHVLKGKVRQGCVFFVNRRCTIYPVRPLQCRAFPFWKECFDAEKDWKLVKTYCKGAGSIDKEAALICGKKFKFIFRPAGKKTAR